MGITVVVVDKGEVGEPSGVLIACRETSRIAQKPHAFSAETTGIVAIFV
jgi:hypothetical protein